MVVLNVVKITGLIFVVMAGLLVVDNVESCSKCSKNGEFCCDQCGQNDGFKVRGNVVRIIMVLVVVVYVVEMTN